MSGACTIGGGPSADRSPGLAAIPAPHAKTFLKKPRLLLMWTPPAKEFGRKPPYQWIVAALPAHALALAEFAPRPDNVTARRCSLPQQRKSARPTFTVRRAPNVPRQES